MTLLNCKLCPVLEVWAWGSAVGPDEGVRVLSAVGAALGAEVGAAMGRCVGAVVGSIEDAIALPHLSTLSPRTASPPAPWTPSGGASDGPSVRRWRLEPFFHFVFFVDSPLVATPSSAPFSSSSSPSPSSRPLVSK